MIDKEAVRVRRLVKVIGRREMTRKGIMAELDLSEGGRRNFHANYVKPAMDEGLMCMLRPGSPTSPEQSYRLTAKGLEMLALLSPDMSK